MTSSQASEIVEIGRMRLSAATEGRHGARAENFEVRDKRRPKCSE
jgi:hypothetical protein